MRTCWRWCSRCRCDWRSGSSRSCALLHWAHRFRYTLYDGLQVKHLNEVINLLCYGGALVGAVVTAYVLWRLP